MLAVRSSRLKSASFAPSARPVLRAVDVACLILDFGETKTVARGGATKLARSNAYVAASMYVKRQATISGRYEACPGLRKAADGHSAPSEARRSSTGEWRS